MVEARAPKTWCKKPRRPDSSSSYSVQMVKSLLTGSLSRRYLTLTDKEKYDKMTNFKLRPPIRYYWLCEAPQRGYPIGFSGNYTFCAECAKSLGVIAKGVLMSTYDVHTKACMNCDYPWAGDPDPVKALIASFRKELDGMTSEQVVALKKYADKLDVRGQAPGQK